MEVETALAAELEGRIGQALKALGRREHANTTTATSTSERFTALSLRPMVPGFGAINEEGPAGPR